MRSLNDIKCKLHDIKPVSSGVILRCEFLGRFKFSNNYKTEFVGVTFQVNEDDLNLNKKERKGKKRQ